MMFRAISTWFLVATFCCSVQAQDAPVPAKEAATKFKLTKGFKATLFAGEPEVLQPIAIAFDDRGRLWVVECHTYPQWESDRHDRVLILEDTDNDGEHDKRTVFLDNLQNLTGIEVGFGGVWLTAVPNLLFVPDANQDDKPDGPAVVKLDGWDLKARHNVVNGITWAPDGWLWGLNGILSNSTVGKPGTPDNKRVKMNCGVWRYHPVTEQFDVVAHGTTNPWGLDFDQYGEAFITNCVIKHAFHVVPGAHFERMFGQDINPRTYQLIPSIADHIHWGGGHWTESRSGEAHDAPGGGHAHSGCMVYLGTNWPEKYRGRLYTCNIHGNRVNQDRLERHGSSYVAKHEPDFLMANDPWFRGIAVKYGPDGGVYVVDWSDTGECHNYEIADRTNGRIYKVVYGETEPFQGLAGQERDLLNVLLAGQPGWQAQHALRAIHERSKSLSAGFIDKLKNAVIKHESDAARLHALWALNLCGAIDDELRMKLLKDPSEHVASWAIRTYDPKRSSKREQMKVVLVAATVRDSSKVRLSLADLAMRDPDLARTLSWRLANREDTADDPYLPYLIWYAMEANLSHFTDHIASDLRKIKTPLVRELFARRLTEPGEKEAAKHLNELLDVIATQADDPGLQQDLARGIFASVDGRRDVKMPERWRAAYQVLAKHEEAAVRDIAVKLALTFGDEEAIGELLAMVQDDQIAADRRAAAVAALAQGKVAKLSPILFELLDDSNLNVVALRNLPAFAEEETPAVLLRQYKSWDADTRREALATLSARADWAAAMLDAVDEGEVEKTDFTAYHWQQLVLLNDKAITERVERLFGKVRPTKDDRQQLVVEWKEKLSEDVLANADPKHGRVVFNKTCAACHKLFESGGNIGPELTGAQRSNLDYVLSNVLDPSAVVPRDYQMQVVETKDGRVLVGILKTETDAVLTLQTATALVKIAKSDIESRDATPQSMMPEGLIQQFKFEEVRDLIRYLRSPSQVE